MKIINQTSLSLYLSIRLHRCFLIYLVFFWDRGLLDLPGWPQKTWSSFLTMQANRWTSWKKYFLNHSNCPTLYFKCLIHNNNNKAVSNVERADGSILHRHITFMLYNSNYWSTPVTGVDLVRKYMWDERCRKILVFQAVCRMLKLSHISARRIKGVDQKSINSMKLYVHLGIKIKKTFKILIILKPKLI